MFFTQNPLTRPGFESLRDVTFLPFMSLIIRPLGEFLTWMPAFPQGRATAGAPFRCPRQVHQLPHADAAWRVLGAQLGELRDRTQALSMLPDMPVWLAPRLQMLAENAWRMHHNFYEYLRVG